MPKAEKTEKKATISSVEAEIAKTEKRRDAAHEKLEEAKKEEAACNAQLVALRKELDALKKEASKGKLESAIFKTDMSQDEIDQTIAALATALKNPDSRQAALNALQAIAANPNESTGVPKEE